jgi:oxygen-dependent protoporphyrinogen oxidase
VDALVKDLRGRGVTLLADTPAVSVARAPEGWRVQSLGGTFDAGVLVVAVDGPTAVDLLKGPVPAIAGKKPASGPDIKLVTLVLDNPGLDSRPRGTGVLVAPQTPGIEAKALTHATGKWDWLADAAGPGRHVLRLSYGRAHAAGEDSAGPDTDNSLLAASLRDAAALLGVSITRESLVDWDVVRWRGSLPFAAVGHRARVTAIREACTAPGGLALVGGWVAGNGLAAVVSDTRAQIRNLIS